jgi:hypothetical protein
VAGNDPLAHGLKLSVDHMQVSAADAASGHAQPQLAWPGLGIGAGLGDQRLAGRSQGHR